MKGSTGLRGLSFLSLLALLAAGMLIEVTLNPGPFLADIPEIAFPLGVLSGFLVFAYLVRSQGDERFENRVGRFGWFGAIVGGVIGIWLLSRPLSFGWQIDQSFDVVKTAVDVGILAGGLVGASTVMFAGTNAVRGDDRRRILSESTWTNRPEPDSIPVEVATQLAELEGSDPLETEPLATYVNPDVFSELRASGGGPWQFRFYTDEYEVRVTSQGTVTVYDGPRDARASDVVTAADITRWR